MDLKKNLARDFWGDFSQKGFFLHFEFEEAFFSPNIKKNWERKICSLRHSLSINTPKKTFIKFSSL